MPKYELKLKRTCINYEYATIEIEADNGAAAILKFYERTPDVEEALIDTDWEDNRMVTTECKVVDFDVVRQTVRYENKKGIRARATSHPEWSEENPWVTYINGDAGLHLPTLEAVDKYFESRGFKRVENNHVRSETANKRPS